MEVDFFDGQSLARVRGSCDHIAGEVILDTSDINPLAAAIDMRQATVSWTPEKLDYGELIKMPTRATNRMGHRLGKLASDTAD